MRSFVALFVCVALCVAVAHSETPPKCGENERWVECSGCDAICTDRIPVCTRECKPPKCMCNAQFYRDPNGKCVTAMECDAMMKKTL